MEIFKEVIGYEGIYEISNFGNLKVLPRVWISGRGGINRRNGKMISVFINSDGYKTVTLIKDGKTKGRKIHSLVATAFIENSHSYPEVNHINGIKTDNRVENLEWVTHKKNMIHARKNGLWKLPKSGPENSLSKKVKNIISGEIYGCVQDAADSIGIKRSTLTNWLNGRIKNKSSLRYLNENSIS